jgi:NAD-dependent deacetylase
MRRSDPIVVLTGAGVSAESGIPTFRGAEGLWRQHRAIDLATPEAFRRDPETVWEFYDWRRQVIAECHPNTAHETIVAMEYFFGDFTLITQNIDGLHRRAGNDQILELHGNIWRLRCTDCAFRAENREVPLLEIPPRCPQCSGLLRPDVVWFGEPLPGNTLERAWEVSARAALMLVVGTSALVHPAASLPLVAKQNGAMLVEINPDKTPLSQYADQHLQGPAGKILPQWWATIRG